MEAKQEIRWTQCVAETCTLKGEEEEEKNKAKQM